VISEVLFLARFHTLCRSLSQLDHAPRFASAAVIEHCEKLSGKPSKAVVWAHNSHLGDARATDMSWRRKELNVGQLVREHYGDAAYGIGFRCAQKCV
jgi:erythromycin esterase-like protein